MAHVTNSVPNWPILNNLRRMMSCPIFSPSSLLLGPPNPPLPILIAAKTCIFFWTSPPLRQGGGSLLSHIKAKLAKTPKKYQNPLHWHMLNVPDRHADPTNRPAAHTPAPPSPPPPTFAPAVPAT